MSDADIKLTARFQQYFSVLLATSAELKSKVYHVRYRVYCDEFAYEPVDLFPDQQESDEYDDVSLHCLIMHNESGLPAGCVRLVPACSQGETRLLPLEKHCAESLDRQLIERMKLNREQLCEISRLAVDRLFRRRSGEAETRYGEIGELDVSQQEKRTFPLIAVAAFLAATAMTELTGKTSVLAMMEPFLPRMMQRSGIFFKKVGVEMNYHGIRAPYFGCTETVLVQMQSDIRDFYDWIYQQLAQQYNV